MEPILFLTQEFPFPATHGSKIRDLQILRALGEHRKVELICFKNPNDAFREPTVPTSIPLQKLTWVTPSHESVTQAFKEARSRCSILWASQCQVAPYLKAAKELDYSIIWDANAVQSKITFESALKSIFTWYKIPRAFRQLFQERRTGKIAKLIIVSSELEAFRMQRLVPAAKVRVIPNCIDLENYADARNHPGSTLFFSGSLDQFPNIEALRWFLDEILPRIKGAMGDALPKIVVAGSNPSSELTVSLRKAGIEIEANPASVLPFLQEASVVFVPIRSGGGTRHKILEAMAAGKAVVSTGKGAEGLELAPCFDIWIANSPDPFAKHIVKLLRNPKLRNETGANGLKHIENRYDWECIRHKIAEIADLLKRPSSSGGV